jgi:hypothetical protein
MKGEWIQEPKCDTSVVFVHGILSSGEACWQCKNGVYWPKLLRQEEELEGLGIYVFTYRSDIFSGNYQLGDAVDSLKELLRLDHLLEGKRIIFVGHSMGGIVVRQYLVVQQTDLIERDVEVGLFLVASPSLGAVYANVVHGFAKILGNSQIEALRFTQENAWLNDLDKNFRNLKEAGKLSIKGKELIEDNSIILEGVLHKQVVEPFSGARYFGDPYKVPNSDHRTIAKPEGSQAIQHRLLCEFILDMVGGKLGKKKPTRKEPNPVRDEVEYRVTDIVRIMENHPTEMNNEHVLQLQQRLSGYHIGGDKKFEGQSTVWLIQQLRDSGKSYDFLGETRQDLRRIEEITDARTGEREAGKAQNMDYESLCSIRDRLQETLKLLTNQ